MDTSMGGDSVSELKTKPSGRSVEAFVNAIADEKKRRDAYAVLDLNQLDDIHLPTLRELVRQSVKHMSRVGK